MEQITKDSFEIIYREFYGTLHMIAKKRQIPSDYVDDIVHDAFLDYFLHYTEICDNRQKRIILIRILKNKSIDYYRKHKNTILSLETVSESFYASVDLDPAEIILNKEKREYIWNNINSLKEKYKNIIMLYYFEKKSTDEICELLNISNFTFYKRLSRARKLLNSILSNNRELKEEYGLTIFLFLLLLYLNYDLFIKKYH